jgi:putative glycosyltransferase (TIGR04372 family)
VSTIKFSRVVRKTFLLPFVLLFLFFVLAIRPIFSIQVISLPYNFGDLLFCVHYFESINETWNKRHRKKRLALYCAYGKITNALVSEKLSHKVALISGDLAWLIWKIFRIVPNTVVKHNEFKDPIPEFLDCLLTFTKSEEMIGSQILENTERNFICLNVRDSAYDHHLGRSENFIRKIRNSNIDDYKGAIEYLVNNDILVFRMGLAVEKTIEIINTNFIDYASNGLRTELLDIFLGAKCKFAVSTGSGWDAIPEMFKRPILEVNVFDCYRPMNLARKQIAFPKIFWSIEKGRPLTLCELIELFHSGVLTLKLSSPEKIGLKIRDLSSEELLDAVREMVQRVDGIFVETPEQKEMQAKAKYILSNHPKLQPSPNYFPVRLEFASCFLSRYPNFLDGLD